MKTAQWLERSGVRDAMWMPFSMIAWHAHQVRAEEAENLRRLATAVAAGMGDEKAWKALK